MDGILTLWHEGLLKIPQSTRIGASPSDGFSVIYPEHLLGWGLATLHQSAYSTAAADWNGKLLISKNKQFFLHKKNSNCNYKNA